jgi:hypothetical protein
VDATGAEPGSEFEERCEFPATLILLGFLPTSPTEMDVGGSMDRPRPTGPQIAASSDLGSAMSALTRGHGQALQG